MFSLRSIPSSRKSTVAALGVSAVGAFVVLGWLAPVGAPRAQDAVEQDQPAAPPARKPAPKPAPKPKPVQAEKPPAQPAAVQPPPPAAGQDVAAKLRENRAGTCSAQLNAVAAQTMGSVAQFNTASHWPDAAADKRIVSVSVAQKYPEGGAIPFAATSVVAAPNPQGSCDAFAIQVIPSPLPCARLRDTIAAANGRQLADLVGIPLMQDAGGQTMLVPTAANTCVLVALKTSYAK